MFKSKFISKSFSSESSTESVSVAEAKAHLYIEVGNSDFDSLLTTLIKEVREYIEEITCLGLISRTVTCYIDYESAFNIPFAPVTSFTSASLKTGINTYEAKTINQDFEVENGLFISYIGGWRFKLIYVAGYTSSTIPVGLKLAFLNEIAKRFEHRGDQVIVSDTNELLMPYKMIEWLM